MNIFKKAVKHVTTKKYFQKYELIPVWNFFKIIETQDLRYLLILDDYNELPKIDVDIQIWLNIYYEHLDNFGEPEEVVDARNKNNQYWIKYWKFVETKNRKLITELEIAKKRLIKDKKIEKFDFERQVAILETHFKINFDLNKMSAKRYFTYLKLYQDAYKEHERKRVVK
jgi:hypothetical protein